MATRSTAHPGECDRCTSTTNFRSRNADLVERARDAEEKHKALIAALKEERKALHAEEAAADPCADCIRSLDIRMVDEAGSGLEGTLEGTTVAEIEGMLGPANCEEEEPKVSHWWGFTVAVTPSSPSRVHCGIWSWKGSAEYNSFSTSGPAWVFRTLFPSRYYAEGGPTSFSSEGGYQDCSQQ